MGYPRLKSGSVSGVDYRSEVLFPGRWRKRSGTMVFIFEASCAMLISDMDSRKLALLCRELADEKKAEDLVIMDVRKVSSITDYFVVATGTSEPHLRAIVEEITETLREDHELRPRAMDGGLQTSWVVLDFFDVIVHLMRADVRKHYNLEGLWGDVPRLRAKPARRAKTVKVKAGGTSGPGNEEG